MQQIYDLLNLPLIEAKVMPTDLSRTLDRSEFYAEFEVNGKSRI